MKRIIWISIISYFCCMHHAVAKPILDIERWQTRNGTRVLFVAAQTIPIVNISMAFNAGSARDGDLPGLAMLTSSLLNQGTASNNADQIADRFEEVGADFDTKVSQDMAVVSLRTVTIPEFFNKAVKVFTDVVAHSSFPINAIQRETNLQLSEIKQQEQDPDALAANKFYRMIYAHHPYGHNLLGNKESVPQIKAENIREFYRKYYVAKNAVLVIVGDLTKAQAQQLSERISGELVPGQAAAALPAAPPIAKTRHENIAFAASQTQLLLGHVGVARNDPDIYALAVGNYSLGGGSFVSRLFQEVRDKRGLSYGIYSAFVPYAQPGPFLIGLATRTEKSSDALSLTLQELRRFVADGPTEAEVSLAKQHIIGNFPLRLDSNKAITDALVTAGFYRLPDDYFERYRERIAAVTLEDVKGAYTRHVHPDHLAIVTVGRNVTSTKG